MASVRQEIRFCTSRDGARIAYATLGKGPPLVKAAHWLSHLEFDVTSPVWRHWLIELGRQRTFIRYDQRGCGLSDRDVEDFSFEAWVADLEAVVDASGLTRFSLLGMSQGGPIGIAYAVRHPERVSHLVLYGTYARGRFVRAASAQERDEAEIMIKLVELGWGRDNPALRQMFTTQFLPEGSAEQHKWFNDLQRVSTSPANAARLMRGFASVDVRDLATRVPCPTLVLHATDDARIPFDEGRLLAALIPGARFVPLLGCNHILQESEPAWEGFVSELRAFLPEAPAATAAGVLAELTARERQILELIAYGLDNQDIAERLSVAEKTVRNHITSIFSKLDVQTRAQAIVCAREAGLASNPSRTVR